MISWIQTYFQKHFRLVFIVMLLAMAVPLVVIYSQSSGLGHSGPKSIEQPFFGHNLGNEQETRRLMLDAQFSAQLRASQPPSAGQLQQYALNRVAGLALADQLHLPQPTEAQISAHVATLPAFQNEQGVFDSQRYAQFGEALKNNPLFNATDANRVFRDDTRLEALSQLLGGPGYITAEEVRDQLSRTDTTWTVATASLDYAAFAFDAKPTEEALKKFYDENTFRYEVPPTPRVSLVKFTADPAAVAAPTEQELRALYDANPARFPAPTEDKKDEAKPALSLDGKSAPATDNFAKVRAQVETVWRMQSAREAATKSANEFTVALFESKITANSPELTAFLQSSGKSAVAVPPLTGELPAEFAWINSHDRELARLDSGRFFSDPLPMPGGYAVLLWQETLPAHKPLLTEIRGRVASDLSEDAKRRAFIAHGKDVQTRLNAAVKSGQDFATAAAEQKLTTKDYTAFTLRQPPADFPRPAAGQLATLAVGKVSDMVADANQGYFVHLKEKKAPDLSDANPRLLETRQQLAAFVAAGSEAGILNNLVEAELRHSSPTVAEP